MRRRIPSRVVSASRATTARTRGGGYRLVRRRPYPASAVAFRTVRNGDSWLLAGKGNEVVTLPCCRCSHPRESWNESGVSREKTSKDLFRGDGLHPDRAPRRHRHNCHPCRDPVPGVRQSSGEGPDDELPVEHETVLAG